MGTTATPLYQQIYDDLKAAIKGGTYKNGDRIPSEAELSQSYGVSRITVRRAILCCMPVHARRARMYYETLFPDAELFVCPVKDADITRENWMHEPAGIDRVLGEMERCGGQFHAILKEIML